MSCFDHRLQPQDELQWLIDYPACPFISTLWLGRAMHFECCPELGSPPHFFADPRNVAAALQEIALAGLCPQRQHEEINVGSREAVAHDERAVLAKLLIDDPEQLTGTRRPAL